MYADSFGRSLQREETPIFGLAGTGERDKEAFEVISTQPIRDNA